MREYALVFAVAAAVTYLMTPLCRRFATWAHAMTAPRDRDVHTIPTPRLGGLAMYAGVAAALLVAYRLPAMQLAFQQQTDAKAVLIAGGVICLLGAIDDRFGLDALTKLAGQIVAAGVMVLYGVQLLYLVTPFGKSVGLVILTQDIAVPVTIVLTVAVVNAVNLIDGLDGLAAGVVGIAALALFAFSYELSVVEGFVRVQSSSLILAVLAGVCLGFLPHNFSPAKVFMGDSGAMLIGLMLAGGSISATSQIDFGTVHGNDFYTLFLPLLMPLAVLLVPFADLLFAIVRRTRAGRPPWSPDKAHLHHRLLEIGHSHTRAVLIMYGWSALVACLLVTISVIGGVTVVLVIFGVAAVVVAILSGIPRIRATRRP